MRCWYKDIAFCQTAKQEEIKSVTIFSERIRKSGKTSFLFSNSFQGNLIKFGKFMPNCTISYTCILVKQQDLIKAYLLLSSYINDSCTLVISETF